MVRVALLAGLVASVCAPGLARAQRCEGWDAWARRCEAAHEVSVGVVHCLPGGVVLEAAAGGTPLRIEVAPHRPAAFRHVGALGVSPVAEHEDWDAAPEDARRAFDAVLSCLRADDDVEIPEGRLSPSATGRGEPAPLARGAARPPLLPLLSALALLLALGLSLREARPSRRLVWRACASLAAAFAATLALRAWLCGPAFAHQNGQGPLWVSYALCATSAYGPGYQELFGWVASAAGLEPSVAIFAAQALLAATGPPAAFALARVAGARAPLAFAAALAVAVEPALARLSQSESYLGAEASLLLLATACVAVGAWRRRPLHPVLVLSATAAGLLVAQAMRIHPTAWAPAALVPLPVLLAKGSLRRRALTFAVAAAVVGGVSAAGALPALSSVAGGDVGAAWLPDLFAKVPRGRLDRAFEVGVVAALVLTSLARDRLRGALRGAGVFVVLVAAFGTHLIAEVSPIIVHGYVTLFAGPLLGALCAGLDGTVRRPSHGLVAAALVAALALGGAALRAPELLREPTDALEQRFVLDRAPALRGGTVAFLGVAGRRRLHLPLYGACGVEGAAALHLQAERAGPALTALRRPVYWYRSSLCQTEEGRDACARIEAGLSLRRIAVAELPARESMGGLGYLEDPVVVGLFAVEGRP